MDDLSNMEKFFVVVAIIVVGFLVGYPIVGSYTANGSVDYCYVDHQTFTVAAGSVQGNSASTTNTIVTTFSLNGHRSWRSDRVIGTNYPTVESVKADADRLNCIIK